MPLCRYEIPDSVLNTPLASELVKGKESSATQSPWRWCFISRPQSNSPHPHLAPVSASTGQDSSDLNTCVSSFRGKAHISGDFTDQPTRYSFTCITSAKLRHGRAVEVMHQ
ncbi:hypothetical protein BsWGS_27388 [Bradybaena similaris]